MHTKKAMQQTGLKYFSALTPKQKDNTILMLRIIKNGLTEINKGLAECILSNTPIEKTFEDVDTITKKLKGCKLFLYKKTYLPTNIKTFNK